MLTPGYWDLFQKQDSLSAGKPRWKFYMKDDNKQEEAKPDRAFYPGSQGRKEQE